MAKSAARIHLIDSDYDCAIDRHGYLKGTGISQRLSHPRVPEIIHIQPKIRTDIHRAEGIQVGCVKKGGVRIIETYLKELTV